ncbi:MAG: hypothetical protein IJZ15_01800 [Oscillospiraceae bacterium]|nr:hypothetical protein [Oscillospiraceae bacterium]
MLFTGVEDFLTQAKAMPRLSRSEEKALARQMAAGDQAAREALIRSYLPLAAAHIRRAPREIRTLRTVYACIAAVEKGVDSFNFQQDGETFPHHLSWRLRQCITRCIADRS